MKVLHICESIIGGTGSYLSEIISHQAKTYSPENIVLLIPDAQLPYVEQNIYDSQVKIVTFSRPNRKVGILFLIATYISYFRQFRPDVVHAHSSIAGFVVRLWGIKGRAKVVFCPHGWAFDIVGSRLIRIGARIFEKMFARRADKIIVISHHEYNRAIEIGIAPKRLQLILNGISQEAPEVEAAEWQDERIKVLFVGRLDHQKGLDVLLEAVEPLQKDVTLRVIGEVAVNGNKGDFPDLPAVDYLGWMSREEVASQMKACDVLVVPSRWEGFGLVVIEAMRLSVPVIATAVGGLKEILHDGEFGFLVPSENPEALRDCIVNLPRSELRNKGAAGYRQFLAHYTSDRMVREIDETYRAAIAGSKIG